MGPLAYVPVVSRLPVVERVVQGLVPLWRPWLKPGERLEFVGQGFHPGYGGRLGLGCLGLVVLLVAVAVVGVVAFDSPEAGIGLATGLAVLLPLAFVPFLHRRMKQHVAQTDRRLLYMVRPLLGAAQVREWPLSRVRGLQAHKSNPNHLEVELLLPRKESLRVNMSWYESAQIMRPGSKEALLGDVHRWLGEVGE